VFTLLPLQVHITGPTHRLQFEIKATYAMVFSTVLLLPRPIKSFASRSDFSFCTSLDGEPVSFGLPLFPQDLSSASSLSWENSSYPFTSIDLVLSLQMGCPSLDPPTVFSQLYILIVLPTKFYLAGLSTCPLQNDFHYGDDYSSHGFWVLLPFGCTILSGRLRSSSLYYLLPFVLSIAFFLQQEGRSMFLPPIFPPSISPPGLRGTPPVILK